MSEPRRAFSKIDIERARDATDLRALIGREITLERRGSSSWCCCPFHFEDTASFEIKEHRFKCYGCGESGDCFSWLMKRAQMSFIEAVREIGADAGLWDRGALAPRPAPAPLPERREAPEERAKTLAQKQERARGMWRSALPAAGSPVETYWRARGLGEEIPPTIRFLPDQPYRVPDEDAPRRYRELGRYPVMIAPISFEGGLICTVHRTYLLPDGSAKAQITDPEHPKRRCSAKKVVGAPDHGAIRLTAAAPELLLGEGIETTWAARLHRRSAGAWAGYSLSHIAGAGIGRGERNQEHPGRFLPSMLPDMDRPGLILPAIVAHVILLRDADSKDQASIDAHLERAAQRFIREGRRASIASPPDGMDFADWNLRRVERA